jgi:hypothetical protein
VSTQFVLDSGATKSVMARRLLEKQDSASTSRQQYEVLRPPLKLLTADGVTFLTATHRLVTDIDVHVSGGAAASVREAEFLVVENDSHEVLFGEPLLAQMGIPTMSRLGGDAVQSLRAAGGHELLYGDSLPPTDVDSVARVFVTTARSRYPGEDYDGHVRRLMVESASSWLDETSPTERQQSLRRVADEMAEAEGMLPLSRAHETTEIGDDDAGEVLAQTLRRRA